MATTIELDGIPTWYDERGMDHGGTPVVLLHGGLMGAWAWDGMAPGLAGRFHLFLPERRGHGHTPDVDGPITYDLMADDTVAFLERVVGRPADLVGHSDGAIIALLVAMRRPDLVRRIVPISGNFHHDGADPIDITPEQIDGWLGERYAAESPDGLEHLPVFAEKVLRMFREEPTLTVADIATIGVPALVIAADRDGIHLDHTAALFGALPDARLAIVPGTTHGLIWEQPDEINRLVTAFLTEERD